MAQRVPSDLSKLIPQLNIQVKHVRRRFSNPEGPLGRLKKLRQTVTALVKHERIELNTPRALEARGFAERLITEAIRHGSRDNSTMELADFWLEEKQLIHKLFKVLVPRFHDYKESYTNVYNAPVDYNRGNIGYNRTILELKGNPFPPVVIEKVPRRTQLHNVLLEAARLEFYESKNKSF